MPFLIHDHDTKFSAAIDNVFVAEGIEIILTPFQAPKANALAERWCARYGKSASINCLF